MGLNLLSDFNAEVKPKKNFKGLLVESVWLNTRENKRLSPIYAKSWLISREGVGL